MVKAKANNPAVKKGRTFPFPVAAACWVDLLGYGAMMSSADFNPSAPNAKSALKRLKVFHEVVASCSGRNFPTLVMNDGAVAYRDLSFRSSSVTYDFLCRCWKLYTAITEADKQVGGSGCRMVLATGLRVHGRRAGLDHTAGHLASIFERLSSGAISVEEAIREASRAKPAFDVVPQLQANFAFTKAYLAESSGSRAGLPGPAFYVDMALFGKVAEDWIELGPSVVWRHKTLSLNAEFREVLALRPAVFTGAAPASLRDAIEVGKHVTKDPDLLARLRALPS